MELQALAEALGCVVNEDNTMQRPRSPKPDGRRPIPCSEQRAVEALIRWQEKRLTLVQWRQRILSMTARRRCATGHAMHKNPPPPRESLEGGGRGTPPPQHSGPDSPPKAFPYPNTGPNRISNRQ